MKKFKNLERLENSNAMEEKAAMSKAPIKKNEIKISLNEIAAKPEVVKDVIFWKKEEQKISINHYLLMKFYSKNGFSKFMLNKNLIVVKDTDNRIEEVGDNELIDFVENYLIEKKELDVLPVFTRGVESYLGAKKMSFLNEIKNVNDKDARDSSKVFFQNCYVEITEYGQEVKNYSQLKGKIWKNRIIDRAYSKPKADKIGQFEDFCFNISKKDINRLDCLRSLLGFLMHRNKERGEIVAVILYDEMMGIDEGANGRTGKSLLGEAIGHLREVVLFNGKDIKRNNWFKYQRVQTTTDVLNMDDINENVPLTEFYSLLTTGVEIERKRKDSIYLNHLQSPKLLITSNHVVNGPGGSSDEARRHEFELANYYTDKFTPEDDYGNRFFANNWSEGEWNFFYYFLMSCISFYLKNGLVKAVPLNFKEATVKSKISNELFDFLEGIDVIDKEMDKPRLKEEFLESYPKYSKMSEHMFSKYLKKYAIYKDCIYNTRKTGSGYFFTISKKA